MSHHRYDRRLVLRTLINHETEVRPFMDKFPGLVYGEVVETAEDQRLKGKKGRARLCV